MPLPIIQMNDLDFSEMMKDQSSWMNTLLNNVCPRLSMIKFVEGREIVEDEIHFIGKIIGSDNDLRTIESEDPVVYKDTLAK